MKGVLAGLIEPSMVALLDNAGRAEGLDGAAGSMGAAVPLLGISGDIEDDTFFSDSCKVVMFTGFWFKGLSSQEN